MDKLNHYRALVTRILSQHAEYTPRHGQIETIPIFDERNSNYLLLDIGWGRDGRVFSVIIHVRVKGGKVWIERDGTEDGVALELVEAGIPKEDIVLAFYRPERRTITDFAVA